MNMTKKINVNFSSLVGLKAELLRKQAEVNDAKLKTESINVLPQLNKKKNKKPVAEAVEKNTKDTVDSEDIVAHKKSKLMLEAKTRLYEKLKRSKNDNDKFLVDFKNKMAESDEEIVDEVVLEKYPIEPDENWVEYEDCFGRTRKCLREDLPHMQRKDILIKQEIMERNADTREKEKEEQYSSIQEKEPEIEIMRRKWEEQTQKLADKVDIHYQDILFDEARTHGVGYYAFSQDEEERTKQQENLANLRKETEKKQKEMKDIIELKDRIEQNRLKAARIRQRIRAGLPAEPTNEELAQENKLINSAMTTDDISIEEDNNKSAKKNEKSSEETDNNVVIVKEISTTNVKDVVDDEDKIKAFEELLDKKSHWHVMSQEEWVHKCRTQRINEFAPMYDNFTSAGFYNSSQSDEQLTCEDKKLDNMKTSVLPKSDMIVKDNYKNNQNDSTDYTVINNRDNTQEVSGNTMESVLNSTINLPNSSQRRAVSYPLSHLSGKYSQDNYLGIHISEQHKSPNDVNIPLHLENNITFSDNSTRINKQEGLPQSINEDNIMAGLKYLREKFEESHSK